MVIRKQYVVTFINRKVSPYWANFRVLTLNPHISIGQLRVIALKRVRGFVARYGLHDFKREAGIEEKQISSREERGLDRKGVYSQAQVGRQIITFERLEE